MPKRSSKDINQVAAGIVARATGQEPPSKSVISQVMAAMGRKGGKAGGKRRAANLTAEQLAEIGRKGAAARWSKKEATRP
jgi:general stress protein YciG